MKHRNSKPIPPIDASTHGGTLVELILLMTLIGLFAVGLLRPSDGTPASAQTAMFKVAHDLRYAQNLAMVTGVNHGLTTLSPTRYEIYSQTPGNPVKDPSTTLPMQIDLSKEFHDTVFRGNYRIEFNSMGKPVWGGGTSVSLANGPIVKSFGVTSNTGALDLP